MIFDQNMKDDLRWRKVCVVYSLPNGKTRRYTGVITFASSWYIHLECGKIGFNRRIQTRSIVRLEEVMA